MMLAYVLIACSGLALFFAWWMVWRALRVWIVTSPVSRTTSVDHNNVYANARRALEIEKDRMLLNIKDIEYEHALGKLSSKDFEFLNLHYRQKAIQIMKSLDEDLGPYIEKAEALVRSSR